MSAAIQDVLAELQSEVAELRRALAGLQSVDELPEYLTPRQVAEHSRRNYRNVLEALRLGVLRGEQKAGNSCWRVKRKEFRRWMDAGAPLTRTRRQRVAERGR